MRLDRVSISCSFSCLTTKTGKYVNEGRGGETLKVNFDDFKHRIGDHSAQEGADYLKFNQLGTQRRMAVMRGFEAYRMKKAAKGWGVGVGECSHKRPGALQSGATWLCRRVEAHKNRNAARGGAQDHSRLGRLDVENADRYQ